MPGFSKLCGFLLPVPWGWRSGSPLVFLACLQKWGKVAAGAEKAGCCGPQSWFRRLWGAEETALKRLQKPAVAAAWGGCSGCRMAAKAGCSGCISHGPAATAAVSAETASAAAGPWLMQPFTGPWLMQPLQPGPAAAGAAKSDHPLKGRAAVFNIDSRGSDVVNVIAQRQPILMSSG